MNRSYSTLVLATGVVAFCVVSSFAQVSRYVVTDDDNVSNTATFFTIGPDGGLRQSTVVPTGGAGLGGGYFATPRVNVARGNGCIYVANNGDNPGTIAGIVESTQTLAGTDRPETTAAFITVLALLWARVNCMQVSPVLGRSELSGC